MPLRVIQLLNASALKLKLSLYFWCFLDLTMKLLFTWQIVFICCLRNSGSVVTEERVEEVCYRSGQSRSLALFLLQNKLRDRSTRVAQVESVLSGRETQSQRICTESIVHTQNNLHKPTCVYTF